ncbi:MAG: cupin-like domain-containing protein [Deltaproteobacteria bacterium]|nr:cupin-like domain-containing protein [Deltaproteobacteria bacterium]
MTRAIERVATPTARAFESDYLRPQQPVVFRGFFAGQDVERIDTLEQAVARLGHVRVPVNQQFFRDFLRFGDLTTHRSVEMTLREYFALVAQGPSSDLGISGQPTPVELRNALRLPDLCYYNCDVSRIASKWFVGTSGSTAHLHFDGDHQHVVLYQMVGRRRVYLVHPRWSGRLFPIFYASAVMLENCPEEEKRRWLDSVEAWECTLEPGDALYWPPHYWHYIEYLEPTLAFNLRFGRGRTANLLNRLHPDAYMQGIGSKLVHDDEAERDWAPVVSDLEAAHARRFATGFEKYLHVRERLVEHHRSVCADYVPLDCCVPYQDAEERIMKRYIALGYYYAEEGDAPVAIPNPRAASASGDGWPREDEPPGATSRVSR